MAGALIMVAVFAEFATGQLVEMQQVGFGLGVAVLLDATIVRTVLVPASMRLLGTRNWYLPSWLDWLPEVHAEGTEAATVVDLRTGERVPAVIDLACPITSAAPHEVKRGA